MPKLTALISVSDKTGVVDFARALDALDVQLLSTAMGENVGAIGAASVVLDARYVPRAPGTYRPLDGGFAVHDL